MSAHSRVVRIIGTYPELVFVIVATGVGLAVARPVRWTDDHQGINVLLFILVFATAATVSPVSLRHVLSTWRQLLAALALGVRVLPVLSWLAARLVSAGPLRNGVLAVGIAPCEIASVATTAMAGGAAALSAAILIGSTLLTVASARVILSVIAHDGHIDAMHILTNLDMVIGIPLALGVLLAATKGLRPRIITVAERIAVGALAGLVLLVAGQVHIGADYLGVLLAVVIIVGVSALLGLAIGRTTSRKGSTSLLLTVSMRDFAIAAGYRSSGLRSASGRTAGPVRRGGHPLGHGRGWIPAITSREVAAVLRGTFLRCLTISGADGRFSRSATGNPSRDPHADCGRVDHADQLA